MISSRALMFTDVHTVSTQAIEIPSPNEGEVLIETAFSGISPGTELRCFAGKQPNSAFPFIPGYSLTGAVIESRDPALPVGQRVFCRGTRRASVPWMWGGHTAHAVSSSTTGVFTLPDSLDLRVAALLPMAAIAYHGLRLAQPLPHETVAIVGLGLIGHLCARMYTMTGARVFCADTNTTRVEHARAAGLTAFSSAAEMKSALGIGADIVVDATGTAAALPPLIALARPLGWDDRTNSGARFVIQGSYPAEVSIPYQAAFEKELQFLIPRDSQPRDIRTVIDLLARERLSLGGLFDAPFDPAQAPDVYAALQRGEGKLTALFAWRDGG